MRPRQLTWLHLQSRSGVFSIASHCGLQYFFPSVMVQLQFGWAHLLSATVAPSRIIVTWLDSRFARRRYIRGVPDERDAAVELQNRFNHGGTEKRKRRGRERLTTEAVSPSRKAVEENSFKFQEPAKTPTVRKATANAASGRQRYHKRKRRRPRCARKVRGQRSPLRMPKPQKKGTSA